MSQLKIPPGAECGYRLWTMDAFENRFSINIYLGPGWGWFTAAETYRRQSKQVAYVPMQDAERDKFLGFLETLDFWSLPEQREPPEGWAVLDGDTTLLAGRDQSRYHEIVRDGLTEEPELETLRTFLHQISGL